MSALTEAMTPATTSSAQYGSGRLAGVEHGCAALQIADGRRDPIRSEPKRPWPTTRWSAAPAPPAPRGTAPPHRSLALTEADLPPSTVPFAARFPGARAVVHQVVAEMVAPPARPLSDAPLPEPQETERRTVLSMVAERLRSKPVTEGRGAAPEGAGGVGATLHRLVGHRGLSPDRVDYHSHPLSGGLRGPASRRRAAGSLLGRRRRGGGHRLGASSHRGGRAPRPDRGPLFRSGQGGSRPRKRSRPSARPFPQIARRTGQRFRSRSRAEGDRASRWASGAHRREDRCRSG